MARKKKEAAVEAAQELIDGGGTLVLDEDATTDAEVSSDADDGACLKSRPGIMSRSCS